LQQHATVARLEVEDQERDNARRPLRHLPWGKYLVGAGQVWLFGFNDHRSWDSRYFGPIPLANVRGEIRPVVTW